MCYVGDEPESLLVNRPFSAPIGLAGIVVTAGNEPTR